MSLYRPYQVIRRTGGGFVRGEAVMPTEYPPTEFMGNVQPATTGDYEKTNAGPNGRGTDALFRIFTKEVFNVAGDDENMPGDIVLFRGKRLLLIGLADRLDAGGSVAHNRYLAVKEIGKAPGESPT